MAGGEVRRFFLRQEAGYQVTADYADAVQPETAWFLCNPTIHRGLAERDGGGAAQRLWQVGRFWS
mgnify:CR=1 FL=1